MKKNSTTQTSVLVGAVFIMASFLVYVNTKEALSPIF